jgi:hypothetical protein
MLAKGLRFHSLHNYVGYILSYINMYIQARNAIISVEVKGECKLLIKTIIYKDSSLSVRLSGAEKRV